MATTVTVQAVVALVPATGAAASPQPAVLPGQLSTRFVINPENPEASVPTNKERDRSPLEFGYFLQDLLEQADQAQKRKDYSAVVRYYRAVAKAVPDNAKSWSKLCEAYERVHDRDRAIRACKYAIDRPAVELGDYLRYVNLIVGKEGDLSSADRTELAAVFTHLEKQDGAQVAVNHLRCELGVKLKDVPMLESCTRELAKVAPDDPKTVVFQWSLALMKGQAQQARELLIRARATGVMRDSVERMETLTPAAGLSRRATGIAAGTVLLALATGAALFTVFRRRRTLSGRAAV